jgi:hypothetical protein
MEKYRKAKRKGGALFSSHNFIMSCANYLKVARHCKI